MLQASAQAIDFKAGRYFGEGQRAHAGLAHFYEYPVTRPIARRSGTITGGRLRDEPSRNRSQTLWHGQHFRRKFRPDMHVQADRYGKGRALIAFR